MKAQNWMKMDILLGLLIRFWIGQMIQQIGIEKVQNNYVIGLGGFKGYGYNLRVIKRRKMMNIN